MLKRMPAALQADVRWVAQEVPLGYAAKIIQILDFHEELAEDVNGPVALGVE